MRTLLAAAIALGLSSGAALAADAGWGVQFSYDAFLDRTMPIGMMQETKDGTSFDAAYMFLACKDGQIAVIFQPTRLLFGDQPVVGRFRGAEGVREYSFKVVDLPVFGGGRAIVGEEAASLLAIFSEAKAPVPFQYEEKSGNFPIVGFAEVQTIVTAHCAT